MKPKGNAALTFLAIFSQVLSGMAADQKECTVHDCMSSYDLSPLSAE